MEATGAPGAGGGPGGPRGRLAVLGAGPMGLFAAWMAARRGWDVTVLEQGRLGESLLSWGGARFFTPLDLNLPEGLRDELPGLPPGDALLTGPEMVERALLPLSRSPRLYGRVLLRHRVAAVGRAGLARRDHPGHPLRHERPFRLLVEGPEGERLVEAERVLDATGAYALPAFAGPGGLPAPGERAAGGALLRRLGDLEAALAEGAAGPVLLLGHGHSAARALELLAAAAQGNPGFTVTWAFRSRNLRPLREVPCDPLPERARAVGFANALASRPPPWLSVRRNAGLASLERSPGGLRAALASPPGSGAPEAPGTFALTAAFTGYRPDHGFLSELALDLAPAWEGPRRLHAVLGGATDCLSAPVPKAADLASGEPGFHLIGAKSYGRSGAFLLRDGLRHVEMILDHAP